MHQMAGSGNLQIRCPVADFAHPGHLSGRGDAVVGRGSGAASDRVGVRSSISLPLWLGHELLDGGFNVYAKDPAAFDADDVQLGMAFANQATAVVLNAHAYWAASELSRNLTAAMATRAVIEQAKGVLMGTLGIDADDAFEHLRTRWQRAQREAQRRRHGDRRRGERQPGEVTDWPGVTRPGDSPSRGMCTDAGGVPTSATRPQGARVDPRTTLTTEPIPAPAGPLVDPIIEPDLSTTGAAPAEASEPPTGRAEQIKGAAGDAASTATDDAKRVASAAADQARSVVQEAKDQAAGLVGQAQGELRQQADAAVV